MWKGHPQTLQFCQDMLLRRHRPDFEKDPNAIVVEYLKTPCWEFEKRELQVKIYYNKRVFAMPSRLPNLRRLFVESRNEAEETAYSRNAFYNLVFFMSSVAVFSLVAQRMVPGRAE